MSHELLCLFRSNFNDCSSCLGSTGTCGWYISCAYCTSCTDSFCTCNQQAPIVNPQFCPAPSPSPSPLPTPSSAAWGYSEAIGLLGLGVIGTIGTAILTFCSLDRLCGQRKSAEWPTTAGDRPSSTVRVLLFAASSFLWLGLSLGLAAPAMPWITCATAYSTQFADAFNAHYCSSYANLCNSIPLLPYVKQGFGSQVSADALAYVNEAMGLGVTGELYETVSCDNLKNSANVLVPVQRMLFQSACYFLALLWLALHHTA